MRRFNLLAAAALMFVFALTGCKKDEEPTGGNNTGGGGTGGTIAITVGSGLNPSYTWGGGNVYSVSVVRQSNPATIVWGAATPGANGIASPVTHGTIPSGAVPTSVSNTENTLSAGVAYRVTVTRLDGSFGYTDFSR